MLYIFKTRIPSLSKIFAILINSLFGFVKWWRTPEQTIKLNFPILLKALFWIFLILKIKFFNFKIFFNLLASIIDDFEASIPIIWDFIKYFANATVFSPVPQPKSNILNFFSFILL